MKNSLFLILFLTGFLSVAQKPIVTLSSEEDSFLIGKPFQLNISIQHNGKYPFYFVEQDSALSTFEILEKQVFPSKRIEDSLILDSVCIQTRSFEIEDTLAVWLSLYQIEGEGDTIYYKTNTKYLIQKNGLIAQKENKLLSHESFITIEKKADTHLYFALLCLFLVGLAMFLWFVLPKMLSNYRKKRFIQKHQVLVNEIASIPIKTKSDLDKLISLWKKDIQLSTGKNYDSFTFSQLKQEIISEKDSFSKLEEMLYSSDKETGKAKESIDRLLEYANTLYLRKLENWK